MLNLTPNNKSGGTREDEKKIGKYQAGTDGIK